jgi:hypothetical protein
MERAPVGMYLLQFHPLTFVVAAVAYALAIMVAIRWLPLAIAFWISLGYLIAHTTGVNSWIAWHPQHAILEPLHNVCVSAIAAWSYLRYFRPVRIAT